MVRLLSVLFVLALSSSASAQMLDAYPEISAIEREAAAQIAVKSPDTVALYAKGLCCASCAIGIRKKVSVLSFVDTTRFNQGIELDPKTQLVRIAIKPGQKRRCESASDRDPRRGLRRGSALQAHPRKTPNYALRFQRPRLNYPHAYHRALLLPNHPIRDLTGSGRSANIQ